MKVHQASKIRAIIEEVEASFKFITLGLLNLNDQNSIVSNNHVALQLLSAGFERIVKILLLIKHKHLEGNFPELPNAKNYFRDYNNGHGIKKMLDELVAYSTTVDLMQKTPMVVEDMKFLETDLRFRDFLEIITQFSIQQRYYYIDTIILENEVSRQNPFSLFENFICNFEEGVDVTKQNYEEESLKIKNSIICIEKGVRAISRFFTHGFDNLGRQYFNNFSNFIFLDDEELGLLNYGEKKQFASDSYQPLNVGSTTWLEILAASKSKIIHSSEFKEWDFMLDYIEVFSLNETFFFAKIGDEIFALTGATSTKFGIPVYLKSSNLKPRKHALYLLDKAKAL